MRADVLALDRQLRAVGWEERAARIEAMARSGRPREERLLLGLLESRDSGLRTNVVEALWEFGSVASARKAARAALNDRNLCVRDEGTMALGEIGTRGDTARLLERLEDPQWVVRASAAQGLVNLGTRRGLAAAERALFKDRHPVVKGYAAMGFVLTGDRAYIPMLERAYKRFKGAYTRTCLEHALLMMGEERYLEPLLAHLEEGYWPNYRINVWYRVLAALEEAYLDRGRPLPSVAVERVKAFVVQEPPLGARRPAEELLARVGIEALAVE